MFQPFFVAQANSLVGSDHYVSWRDWTNATLAKLGKAPQDSSDSRGSSDYSNGATEDAVMEELDAMGEGQLVCGSVGDPSFLVTEQPPLTPWPCHTPTQKEIEDAQTEGIGERVQEEGVMKNEDIQMVYSTVHGWA